MQRDILKWGKAPQLCFQDEKEFYRTLGQLTNELAFTISFEPNSKTGSYSDAYRIRALSAAQNISDALKKKMKTANRVNCNEYVQYLIENHGFIRSGNEIKRNYDDVYATVDSNFRDDFKEGYYESTSDTKAERVVYSTEKIDVSGKKLKEQKQPVPRKSGTRRDPKRKKSGKRDYVRIQIENYEIGEAGELLVWEYEKEILKKAKIDKKMEWVSRKDDNCGYDIKSYDVKTGEPKYIEVKTTSGNKNTPFYISSNEIKCSKEKKDNYYIYRVYKIKNKGVDKVDFYIISGDITEQDNFEIEKTEDSLVKIKKVD